MDKILKDYTYGVVSLDKYKEYDYYLNKERVKDFHKTAIVFIFGFSLEKVSRKRYLAARFAFGEDYHLVVTEKLEAVAKALKLKNYEIFTDNSPYDEKLLAYLAGLGGYGKNNLIINEKYGTNFAIGEIITDKEFLSDNLLLESPCGDCRLCLDACPTMAITDAGFTRTKCISYLTQYISDDFPLYDKVLKYAVGCDICQVVCPFNKVEYLYDERFSFNKKAQITLEELDNLNNRSFKEYYNNKAFSWIGYLKMLRNILTLEVNNKNISLDRLKDYQKQYKDVKWFYNHLEYLKEKVG